MLNRKNATLKAEVVSYNKKKETVTLTLRRLDNSEMLEDMTLTVNSFKLMFPEVDEILGFQIKTEILPDKYALKFDNVDNDNGSSITLSYQLTDGETIPFNEIQNLTRIIVNQMKDAILPKQKFAEISSNMEVCYYEGNLFVSIKIS